MFRRCAPGAPRFALRPQGWALKLGVSNFCRFRALERTVQALGEAQTAAFSSWASAADSISAKGVFRDVVVLTVGLWARALWWSESTADAQLEKAAV